MGYVANNLTAGESVVYQTRLHWVIFMSAVVMVVLAVWMFMAGSGLGALGLFFLMLGAALALGNALQRQTSEFAVTNRRVLIKTGLVSRKSLDINLAKVESIQVEQGLLARLLDYGTIVVRGSGGTGETFKNISAPLTFRLQVQEQIEQRTASGSVESAPQVTASSREQRECPHCAELILAKAKVCKHCGGTVESSGA